MTDTYNFFSIPTQEYLSKKIKLDLPLGGRSQEIHAQEHKKCIWLTLTNASTSTPFTRNAFKADPDAGHVSFQLTEQDQLAIQNVDAQVYELVLLQERYKNVEQVRLTPRTWEQMFRRSMYGGVIKVAVNKSSVAFFDKDKNVLNNSTEQDTPDKLWNYLGQDTKVNIVLEPTMLWFMNRKAGISWTLKQVRFLEDPKLQESSGNNSYANWQLEDDDDDE